MSRFLILTLLTPVLLSGCQTLIKKSFSLDAALLLGLSQYLLSFQTS